MTVWKVTGIKRFSGWGEFESFVQGYKYIIFKDYFLKFGFFWGKNWPKSEGEVSLWAKNGDWGGGKSLIIDY